jgi:hypothetical protein
MHDLYKLKDNLVKELEELGKQDLSKSTLETVDKLAHAAKNVAKVIECCEEEEYSNRGYSRRGMSYDDGGYSSDGNYVRPDGSYRREIVDSSYARGRGRGARRDAMGRYSSADDQTIQRVRMLLNETTDDQARHELSRLIDRLESM